MFNNKTIKALVVALTLVAGNSMYAASAIPFVNITTAETQPLNVEVQYTESWSGATQKTEQFSLSSANPHSVRGYVSVQSIKVNGQQIWTGDQRNFQGNLLITIQRSGDKFVAIFA